MSSAENVATSAADLIDQEGGIGKFIENVVLGGIIYQFGLQVISAIGSAGSLFLGPVRALGRGMITLVEATIGNVVAVFDAGTQATVLSFTEGTARLLGPLAQPTAVGVGMISVAVFIWTVNYLEISPLSFIRGIRG